MFNRDRHVVVSVNTSSALCSISVQPLDGDKRPSCNRHLGANAGILALWSLTLPTILRENLNRLLITFTEGSA